MERNEVHDFEYLIDYELLLEELIYLINSYKKDIVNINLQELLEYLIDKYDDIKEYLSN